VPILPNVTNIGLQTFVTCTIYIQVFYYHFESIVLKDTCYITKMKLTNSYTNLVCIIDISQICKTITQICENILQIFVKLGKSCLVGLSSGLFLVVTQVK
jgi:hypothetical protein